MLQLGVCLCKQLTRIEMIEKEVAKFEKEVRFLFNNGWYPSACSLASSSAAVTSLATLRSACRYETHICGGQDVGMVRCTCICMFQHSEQTAVANCRDQGLGLTDTFC